MQHEVTETVEETTEETTIEYPQADEEEKTVTEETKTVTASNSQRSVTSHKERPPPDRLTRPTKASAAKGKGAQETEKPARPVSAPSFESSEVSVCRIPGLCVAVNKSCLLQNGFNLDGRTV